MIARIRTVKPELFQHGALFDLERETGLPLRVAYIGLWCLCDREGRFEWKPREMKLNVLPYDECDFGAVLNALAAGGFVARYEVAGKPYGVVPSFKSHQAINQREAQSKIPEPSGYCAVPQLAARVSAHVPEPVRQQVFERDGRRCVLCGDARDLTIDHIRPRSMGGTHDPTNLRTLCRKCNSGRPVQGEALVLEVHAHEAHVQARASTGNARASMRGREQNGTERNTLSAVADGAKTTWTAEAVDMWKAEIGLVPHGHMGKALKPAVAEYGWPQVRAWLAVYLRFRPYQKANGDYPDVAKGEAKVKNTKFCSPDDFVRNLTEWRKMLEPADEGAA